MEELNHFGIPGMHWGIRRFQNLDGTLTALGRKRYDINDILTNIGNKVLDTYDLSKQTYRKASDYVNDYLDRISAERAQKRFDEYKAKRNEYEKQVGYNEETDNWRKVSEEHNKTVGQDNLYAQQLVQLNNMQNALDSNKKYGGVFDSTVHGTRNAYTPGNDIFGKDYGDKLTESYKNDNRKETYRMISQKRAQLESERVQFQNQFRQVAQSYQNRLDFNKTLEQIAFSSQKVPDSTIDNILSSIDQKINSREYKKYYDMVNEDILMHHVIKGQQNGSES